METVALHERLLKHELNYARSCVRTTIQMPAQNCHKIGHCQISKATKRYELYFLL